ncbi:unnamed protein product [Spirodela intermedia]|uniref:Uncharacterized protein n=1 Tax=Spirodela intermedia TaxID=51605 RepID=A0A7I8IAP1_SPIIN|nr:unnamed protein product [Spirodela intermedia]CAA6653951.1 unnamed protein product [Spirodela intermedia]
MGNQPDSEKKFRFCIDRGGTFTDIYAEVPGKSTGRVMKLLSVDPPTTTTPPSRASAAFSRSTPARRSPAPPKSPPTRSSGSAWGPPERIALCVTRGFRHLLQIGNQARPHIFDLTVSKPSNLYEEVVEADERVDLDVDLDGGSTAMAVEEGVSGELIRVRKPLDEEGLRPQLEELVRKGITSLAVVLLHSYTYPKHELQVQRLAIAAGFRHVSLSSALTPMIRAVPRGLTASVDAYLTPVIREYLSVNVLFMQSDGGLAAESRFSGHKAVLSGPAGGVVGYSQTLFGSETTKPLIGFDMGGTSTDVSRYAGSYEQVLETQIAGAAIQAPQLDISTVAAGGGSKLKFQFGAFRWGPNPWGPTPAPSATAKAALTCRPHAAPMTAEEVALGFVHVANEAMCRPIRQLTEMKGHETRNHALACFGGAGPQHACAVARSLGMSEVFVHRFCGILSAYGMGLADVVEDLQEPFAAVYGAPEKLRHQGFADENISTETFLNLRYDGTDTALMVKRDEDGGAADIAAEFVGLFEKEYGFRLEEERRILICDVRARGVGPLQSLLLRWVAGDTTVPARGHGRRRPGARPGDHHEREQHRGRGARLPGEHHKYGNIRIEVGGDAMAPPEEHGAAAAEEVVQVAIFNHRFMGIAEQMGRTLQRTSISTNIKERLDFSCAIFGPRAGWWRTLPTFPSTSLRHWGGDLAAGDVLLTNHPAAGGTHLPDITVITPVFNNSDDGTGGAAGDGGGEILFFVASRGHHADIGGITPGSMPPSSKFLWEEGAAIKSLKLVEKGIFREHAITELLCHPSASAVSGEKVPGARRLEDNLSDLRAQVAANQRGIALIRELIDQYGIRTVQTYMTLVQVNAEAAVREMLKAEEDFMDDGSAIRLKLTVDPAEGSAIFDFSGTTEEVYGNWNAPEAVTTAAVIYSLRCLVNTDIPSTRAASPGQDPHPRWIFPLPEREGGCGWRQRADFSEGHRRCAGGAEGLRVLPGLHEQPHLRDDSFGYYETIGGGAGAGPGWGGAAGVQCHMTNTRITDPEILEQRYPVVLRRFGVREGSGGGGRFRGGDGLVREMEFRRRVVVSILSERRVHAPRGLEGGRDGARGVNVLVRKDGRRLYLGGKNTVEVEPGDVLLILTPGGGGWGPPPPPNAAAAANAS